MPTSGVRHVELALTKLVQRVREEFEEAAGLRVTVGEAARFFGLDTNTCDQVLTALHQAGFLVKGVDGRYRRV